jgi:hypothetical protein
LLSYDTGHDPRGKSDQTTVDYPLQSPFSLDGEDLIDDPAARERIVVSKLHPQAVAEEAPAYLAFKEMQAQGGILNASGSLIQAILKIEDAWMPFLIQAKAAVFEHYTNKLPDRVRSNHIIVYFGILIWCYITNTEVPSPAVLSESLGSVYDIESGRSRTLVDDMIEYIVNKANNGGAYFKYTVADNIFWFQMTPAHEDWLLSRRRAGRGALDRDAIKMQLQESQYQVPPLAQRGVWMYGVDLGKAVAAGLDVPMSMNSREIRISL